MRSTVRAYSHQGHGPRADQQVEYKSATSDSNASLAKGSRVSNRGLCVKTAVLHRPPGSRFSSRSVVLPQHLVRSGAQALQGPQRAYA